MVGTCQKLEKNFLRLTSVSDRRTIYALLIDEYFQEADPATIRPLAVLERAFSFVMNKYRLNKDWSYIGDQLRSIRQDLMVQSIRNDLTVLVYEENARIALEMVGRLNDGKTNAVLLSHSRVIGNSLTSVRHNWKRCMILAVIRHI